MVKSNAASNIKTSWFKQPWAWFTFSVPAATVVAGLYTLGIAFKNADPLVTDEYYKEGLAINQVLDKEHLAESLKLGGSLSLAQDGWISVNLHSAAPMATKVLLLSLTHATLADQDQQIVLTITPDGSYRGKCSALSNGKWIATLEPDGHEWRIGTDFITPISGVIELQ